jgi:hypothetical protein
LPKHHRPLATAAAAHREFLFPIEPEDTSNQPGTLLIAG